jgi:hypothetical protein
MKEEYRRPFLFGTNAFPGGLMVIIISELHLRYPYEAELAAMAQLWGKV